MGLQLQDVNLQISHSRTMPIGLNKRLALLAPRGRMRGRLESQVVLVDLLGTRKALATLSAAAQRRVQKLRCGWLPVNRRVSREDPDLQFHLESGRSLLAPPSSFLPHSFQSRRRFNPKQASGFYPILNMVIRVKGGWRYRGGFFLRTNAAARYS
jgi:hypothetical protein